MNKIIRAAFRITQMNGLSVQIKNPIVKRQFTRNLWHMARSDEINGTGSSISLHKPSLNCACGCGMQQKVHTKAETELVQFLAEEIIAEKKAQKVKLIPSQLAGFDVKLDNSEVEMTKQAGNEKITVSFNINHTVDADDQAELEPTGDKQNFAEMKSKPTFEVDIQRNNTTLSFTCSFLQGVAQEGEYNDVFGIDEVTIYEGAWQDKNYAVAGDVLDGYLYDLLMNLLEEKGISNEFAEKLSEFSTTYEHTAYISLLEGLSKFTTTK